MSTPDVPVEGSRPLRDRGALSPKRAAEYLDSTEGTLAKWRHQRVGPPYLKIGGKVLYRVEGLDEYLRRLEAETLREWSDG